MESDGHVFEMIYMFSLQASAGDKGNPTTNSRPNLYS
jgi:hypothetical protein